MRLPRKMFKVLQTELTSESLLITMTLGFLCSPSVVSAYQLTGSQLAKEAGIKAADQLLTRFNDKGGFIQAWGQKGAKDENRFDR